MNSLERAVAVVVGLGVAVFFAVPVLGPGLSRWGDSFLGADDVDLWGTQWFYWLIGRRVLAAEPFAHTDLLFYPWGKDVYLHTGCNVLDAALALPWRFVLGPELGYNAFVVAVLAFNGLAAALLARELEAPPWAVGLLAGLCAFDPVVLAEVDGGRHTQAMLGFLLLFWRDWLRLRRGASWRVALRAGLWMALTGLCYWFYAIFSALAAVLAGLWLLVASPHRRALAPQLAVAGALAGALALPLAWPMISALQEGQVPGVFDLSLWSWTAWSPVTEEGWEVGLQLWDPLSGSLGFAFLDEGELLYAPGTMATPAFLLLAGLAGLLLGREAGPGRGMILVALGVGVVVAMGPAVSGTGPVDPLYLALAELIPPMRRLWWPARALVLVELSLLAGAALLFARLRTQPVLSGVIGLVLLAGTWAELRTRGPAPLSLASAAVPRVYACLAEAEDGAVLELPMGVEPARLHYQAVHGKPLFGGMVEDNPVFAPREAVRFRERNRWVLDAVARSTGGGAPGGQRLDERVRDAGQELAELGFRYVVVDWDALAEARVHASDTLGVVRRQRHARVDLRELLGHPAYDDGHQAVYLPWGGDFSCQAEVASP